MIYLVSSSTSRVDLLKNCGINFTQISFEFNENFAKNCKASAFVQRVVLEKERQFCENLKTNLQENLQVKLINLKQNLQANLKENSQTKPDLQVNSNSNLQELPKQSLKNQTLLFADSVVSVKDAILTKAKDKDEARKMLGLQSGQSASVLSAFILKNPQKKVFSLSKTTFFFKEFDAKDLENYLENELYKNKAGALMCEGFHKKYIIKKLGNLSTALGLDTKALKAYL